MARFPGASSGFWVRAMLARRAEPRNAAGGRGAAIVAAASAGRRVPRRWWRCRSVPPCPGWAAAGRARCAGPCPVVPGSGLAGWLWLPMLPAAASAGALAVCCGVSGRCQAVQHRDDHRRHPERCHDRAPAFPIAAAAPDRAAARPVETGAGSGVCSLMIVLPAVGETIGGETQGSGEGSGEGAAKPRSRLGSGHFLGRFR